MRRIQEELPVIKSRVGGLTFWLLYTRISLNWCDWFVEKEVKVSDINQEVEDLYALYQTIPRDDEEWKVLADTEIESIARRLEYGEKMSDHLRSYVIRRYRRIGGLGEVFAMERKIRELNKKIGNHLGQYAMIVIPGVGGLDLYFGVISQPALVVWNGNELQIPSERRGAKYVIVHIVVGCPVNGGPVKFRSGNLYVNYVDILRPWDYQLLCTPHASWGDIRMPQVLIGDAEVRTWFEAYPERIVQYFEYFVIAARGLGRPLEEDAAQERIAVAKELVTIQAEMQRLEVLRSEAVARAQRLDARLTLSPQLGGDRFQDAQNTNTNPAQS